TIKVEYELKPLICGTCLVFVHKDMQCPKHGMVDLRKQGGTSNDGFQTVQKKDFHGPFGSKQGIVDSSKRNVVFAPETKVYYFDRKDMECNDMGHAVEEVEHENTYSENG
nr:hypothetical protein [Tanacetum cinerariifolium]